MVANRIFVIRTVRNGSVRIDGVTYRPRNDYMAYDGRLDGLRFAFCRYWTAGKPEKYVSLWGTEEAFRKPMEVFLVIEGPNCVDGKFPWQLWHAEE